MPEIVLTLGSRGALVVTADVAALIAPTCTPGWVDLNGAGDVFLFVYLDAPAAGSSPSRLLSGRAGSRELIAPR